MEGLVGFKNAYCDQSNTYVPHYDLTFLDPILVLLNITHKTKDNRSTSMFERRQFNSNWKHL